MARPTLNRCDLAAWLRKVIELDGYDMPFLFGIFYKTFSYIFAIDDILEI